MFQRQPEYTILHSSPHIPIANTLCSYRSYNFPHMFVQKSIQFLQAAGPLISMPFFSNRTPTLFLNRLTVRAHVVLDDLWLFGFRQMPLSSRRKSMHNLKILAGIHYTFVVTLIKMCTNIRTNRHQGELAARRIRCVLCWNLLDLGLNSL
jgi:hypothetical protein